MEKDYMLVPCEIKNVKEDEERGLVIVEGYASIYDNIDLGGDRVRPSFFVDDLKQNGNKRPALWQHNSNEPVGIKFYETDNVGLKFVANLPTDDTFVMGRVYPQMKVGSVTGVSIGYWTLEEEYNRDLRCNDLIKGCLKESSFVTFPMNPKATIFSVRKQAKSIAAGKAKDIDGALKSSILDFIKSGEIEIKSEPDTEIKMYPLADEKTEWNSDDAIKSIKENTGCEDKPSRNYHKGFLKVTDEKSFDGYELPYVKYIDGEFRIIPKAIYSIAGQVFNSKFEELAIKQFVNQVYKKLGKQEPFTAGKFFVDKATLKHMEKSDLMSVFDNENVILSSGSKEMIIEALRSGESRGSVPSDGKSDLLEVLKKANEEMKTI